ncbi:MAG: type 1 glutamine amidotransferase [Alphaproteobacteria bacterium]|uniref:Type 1 glutamine amidotransferase n=1 Tax=Candidatus Nitrobium versatile TaxID=2884831 RepID=A0A953JDV7_9BACT|nr:type 1 glutamine amidotransferase [Candidatus Nitrobium versatile]
MAVLICKNISNEGAGTIGDFLTTEGIPFAVVDLSKGESLPDIQDFDTLLMMGGPMSVNEDDLFPYIKEEEALVRTFIEGDKRILGVCLGAQIMAKALGARVYKGKEKEIGWYDVELTEHGLRDPLMRALAVHPHAGDLWRRFKVFHWHGETFDIPEGAVHLASSSLFPHQAFRYGRDAYAFQFHIEVGKEMIHEWLRNEAVDLEGIGRDTERLYDVYYARAMAFYRQFFTSPRQR